MTALVAILGLYVLVGGLVASVVAPTLDDDPRWRRNVAIVWLLWPAVAVFAVMQFFRLVGALRGSRLHVRVTRRVPDMPTFQFEDHVEPVIVQIGDDEFTALPGIPANDFAEFMSVFGEIPPLVNKLRTPDVPASPAEYDADGNVVKEAVEGTEGQQIAAYMEFINVSLRGLELVMTGDSIARIKERASNKERPIEASLLANVFSTLAGYYISGGKEDQAALGEGDTGDASASLPSSATTGGSSEDNSSSEAPLSIGGPTTT